MIPSYQAYLERIENAEKNGKEICTSLIDDMKGKFILNKTIKRPFYKYIKNLANFTLPQTCYYIDSIEYIELNEEEAKKVIELYNKEGLVNRQNAVINRRLKTKQAICKP